MRQIREYDSAGLLCYAMGKAYRNLRPNQLIRFYVDNGMRLEKGKLVKIRRAVRSRVNPLLIFETHVVAKYGHFGTVVNDENFIQAY